MLNALAVLSTAFRGSNSGSRYLHYLAYAEYIFLTRTTSITTHRFKPSSLHELKMADTPTSHNPSGSERSSSSTPSEDPPQSRKRSHQQAVRVNIPALRTISTETAQDRDDDAGEDDSDGDDNATDMEFPFNGFSICDYSLEQRSSFCWH